MQSLLMAKQLSEGTHFVTYGLFLDIKGLFKPRWSIILIGRKSLFKIEFLLSKVDPQVKTRLHLFDSVILPNLLYGCELWGYENMEHIEGSHRKFLRRMLKKVEAPPRLCCTENWAVMKLGLLYGNKWQVSGKKSLNQLISVIKSNDKLSCIVFSSLNYKNEVTLWHLAIEQISISCEIPTAEDTCLVYDWVQ